MSLGWNSSPDVDQRSAGRSSHRPLWSEDKAGWGGGRGGGAFQAPARSGLVCHVRQR